ncbi:MAG TPA: GNAT family protein [Candidatus Limnocylindria bacterium]
MLPIRTERLLLRPFEDGDLPALYEMQRREDVTRYLYWGPRSLDAVRDFLERMKLMTGLDEESNALRLAGVLPDTGELVGDYSLFRTSREHRQGEIGYITHPDHGGRGYAVEAARALLKVGFEIYGLHRVMASCDARNAASETVMKRLGMRCEAHFRENELVKGEWTDELIYALLADEWSRRPVPSAAPDGA